MEQTEEGIKEDTASHFSASVTDILIANIRKIFLSILFQFVFIILNFMIMRFWES